MAIYWPTPGLKGRTFKLCVLTRWDFNFCVRSSPLRLLLKRWGFSKQADTIGSKPCWTVGSGRLILCWIVERPVHLNGRCRCLSGSGTIELFPFCFVCRVSMRGPGHQFADLADRVKRFVAELFHQRSLDIHCFHGNTIPSIKSEDSPTLLFKAILYLMLWDRKLVNRLPPLSLFVSRWPGCSWQDVKIQ